MPWSEVSRVALRFEFVTLASVEGANVRELCRRFGISAKTGYKWLGRHRAASGLEDRSRRPIRSPSRSTAELEAAVLAVRDAHSAWGGRKLRAWLLQRQAGGQPQSNSPYGGLVIPSASTITAILRRHGRIDPDQACKHRAWQRFEHVEPNALWQMDFKGHVELDRGRCHPLTVLDDHSRYSIGLQACADERTATVRGHLEAWFRRYGMPLRMLTDNGPPWGSPSGDHTEIELWLIRLGVGVTHGRPYHPQTQGKEERFHRTLAAEVLRDRRLRSLELCQQAFDAWRPVYNHERPHEALGLATPASRYVPSPRSYPEALPPIEYAPGDAVRRVQQDGEISYAGRQFRIGKALRRQPVGVRATTRDGEFDVYFCQQPLGRIDLHSAQRSGENQLLPIHRSDGGQQT